ncbi:hypothetical protein BKA80DRAFT_286670 [Phyllosticta citrichinensis]
MMIGWWIRGAFGWRFSSSSSSFLAISLSVVDHGLDGQSSCSLFFLSLTQTLVSFQFLLLVQPSLYARITVGACLLPLLPLRNGVQAVCKCIYVHSLTLSISLSLSPLPYAPVYWSASLHVY